MDNTDEIPSLYELVKSDTLQAHDKFVADENMRTGKLFIYNGVPMIVTPDGIPCFSVDDFDKVLTNEVYFISETKSEDYGVGRVDNNKLVNKDLYDASLNEAFITALDIGLIKVNEIIVRKDNRQGKIIGDTWNRIITRDGLPCNSFGEFGNFP
ncbi:hypothetical protein RhiirA5_432698 [Rhizophagus irregularis]|uniref:Uncharacterized protein n=1 Tax=Rhizophagus irregularis TaxID=588596 RepID=A0A2I1FFK4_9GLOM|nr:hypothetical protein RhiirA5_432698 [Rhizophagus irregularis]PKC56123.1 hypothetical protein RhiirA1_474465 [Rhizophagus irregularis]PKY33164.1 hypothetical protein RhiirB3_451868 [Rhizophagus irregularis]CAB5353393.1 unnamed protein product [Rhizophagus irregularis]